MLRYRKYVKKRMQLLSLFGKYGKLSDLPTSRSTNLVKICSGVRISAQLPVPLFPAAFSPVIRAESWNFQVSTEPENDIFETHNSNVAKQFTQSCTLPSPFHNFQASSSPILELPLSMLRSIEEEYNLCRNEHATSSAVCYVLSTITRLYSTGKL